MREIFLILNRPKSVDYAVVNNLCEVGNLKTNQGGVED